MANPRQSFLHVGGGLGDVARRFYLSTTYELLGSLCEPTTVLCFSHNPSAMDFFRFHPNSRNLVLMDAGHIYMDLLHDPAIDRKEINPRLFAICGLSEAQQLATRRDPTPIGHFHAPDALPPTEGHVVIHPFARGWGDWPGEICDAVRKGFRSIPDGVRTFIITASYIAADGRRKEEAFPCDLPHVTVLQNLSAPATFSLVARASRFVGTMSALAQVAAFEGVPSMVLHPKRCKDFVPPYSDYSKTIWSSNGVGIPYDATPVSDLEDAVRLFLQDTSPLSVRELFQRSFSIPTF